MTKAGLAETLSDPQAKFTVFAPTNEAFEALGQETLDKLAADEELLKKVLLYHVVEGEFLAKDMEDEELVETVEGTDLRVNVYLKSDFYPGFATVNGKRISVANKMADNGAVHVVANVIFPFPEGDIAQTLAGEGPFTLFAPTNEAFAKIAEDDLSALLEDKDALTEVLLRHVVPGTLFKKGISWKVQETAGEEQIQTQVFKGGVVKVASLEDDARVVDYDIVAENGVIHAIDTVI